MFKEACQKIRKDYLKSIIKVECPHYDYCNVKSFGRINCLTKSSIETCQTYKFYEKNEQKER